MSAEIRYSYKGSPTLKAFAHSDAFVRGLVGPYGSGKSSACVVEIIRRGMAQKAGPDGIRRSRFVVIRNTYAQLKDTSIKTFHQWVPPHLFGEWRVSDHNYTITAFEGVEIEVMFRALDRPDQIGNLLSLELTGAWINEAREVPWAIIDAVQGRVGRYPSMKDGGPTWSGIFMDTNPPDADSWWYVIAEKDGSTEENKRRLDTIAETEEELRHAGLLTSEQPLFEFFKQPSGLGPNAENLSNLIPGYYLRQKAGKSEEWIKVYLKGEYGFVIDGKPVFPDYNEEVHLAKVDPENGLDLKSIEDEPILVGIDFGLTPAAIFCQSLPNGRFIVLDEVIAENMGIDRFSDQLKIHINQHYEKRVFEFVGDPAGNQRAQTDEKTCFEILEAKGFNVEAGLQTLAIRLESVRYPLTRLVGGKPMFQIHPRCKVLRKALAGGYQFRRMQTSAEKFTDTPDKNKWSHPADALEYAMTRVFGSQLTDARPKPKSGDDDFYAFANPTRSSVTGY